MTPCAPCLEAAPCDRELACRRPFADPGLPRLFAGSTKVAPPAGLVGYATDCDALGAVCRPLCGEDPTRERREIFRAFVARRLTGAAADGTDVALGQELAQLQYMETDWALPPTGRPTEGEW